MFAIEIHLHAGLESTSERCMGDRSFRAPNSELGACFAGAMLAMGQASAQPAGLQVDPDRSFIIAIAHKAGLLSGIGVGHEHGIVATSWSAMSCLNEANPAGARVMVTIATASLRIDAADARRLAGLAPSGPSAKDMEEIQAKMIGADMLDALHYPEIRFATTSVRQGAGGLLTLDGTLSLRGRERPMSFPLKLDLAQDGWRHFSGSSAVRQTDYGITPVSISGLVKVKDVVDVRIEIYAKPVASACP